MAFLGPQFHKNDKFHSTQPVKIKFLHIFASQKSIKSQNFSLSNFAKNHNFAHFQKSNSVKIANSSTQIQKPFQKGVCHFCTPKPLDSTPSKSNFHGLTYFFFSSSSEGLVIAFAQWLGFCDEDDERCNDPKRGAASNNVEDAFSTSEASVAAANLEEANTSTYNTQQPPSSTLSSVQPPTASEKEVIESHEAFTTNKGAKGVQLTMWWIIGLAGRFR